MLNSNELFTTIKKHMPPQDIEHHLSDLYVRVTPISKMIISKYVFKSNVSIFKDAIDGVKWYDIPFSYVPYWDEKKENNS